MCCRQVQRRAVGTVARRTFVQAAHGREFDLKLQRNKYHSVLDDEFKLVSGEVLPEVRIDWEQWVRICVVCYESCGPWHSHVMLVRVFACCAT